MKYITISDIPKRIIQKGPGKVPRSTEDRFKRMVLTVEHPTRKEYLILDPDNIEFKGERKVDFIELYEYGYTIRCGYLPVDALIPGQIGKHLNKYIQNLGLIRDGSETTPCVYGYFLDSLHDSGKAKKRSINLPTPDERKEHAKLRAIRNIAIFRERLDGTTAKSLSVKYGISTTAIFGVCDNLVRLLRRKAKGKSDVPSLIHDFKSAKEHQAFIRRELDIHCSTL